GGKRITGEVVRGVGVGDSQSEKRRIAPSLLVPLAAPFKGTYCKGGLRSKLRAATARRGRGQKQNPLLVYVHQGPSGAARFRILLDPAEYLKPSRAGTANKVERPG